MLLRFFVCSTYDVLRKMEETIRIEECQEEGALLFIVGQFITSLEAIQPM